MDNFKFFYKKIMEEVGESVDMPSDLTHEISSPGAERLLKVPDDLERFKEIPMRLCNVEINEGPGRTEKHGVFLLD
ncbi:hypothetical protein Sjap_024174 [Stephania japonica]|uniref:DUF7912 domain-containing protein n=1 Tax=Stephania japonica TaxID=461633 RepID=A0AAP0EG52_9MAGN